MSINISDYNRSAVFIEERDNSAIDRPAIEEGTTHFVPGFSRTSTTFNKPVLVKSPKDREKYFGKIDRFLEKKGSYFHRTLDVVTQTAPVWALNLLKTNSLDQLNYVSMSTSAQTDNGIIKTRQYDDFFNKAGFWQKDTESFLFFAQDNDRIMHLTNMGDKKISVFAFKSERKGFDITAEQWYGGRDKVPTWMGINDLISDYMIRVVVLSGDWSDYTQLSIDPNYSQYFNTSGLRKEQANEFFNKREVTVLGDYEGSLIPYFRDQNNNVLFIESLINNETDITGLFCSYDLEAVETDFPVGNVDIVGHTLVDSGKTNINFLSYNENIEEKVEFRETGLDRLGNTTGIGSIAGSGITLHSENTNGRIDGLAIALQPTFINDATPQIDITGTGTAIINDTIVNVNGPLSHTLSAMNAPSTGNSTYTVAVLYLDETGQTHIIESPTTVEAAQGLSEGDPLLNNLVYPSNYPMSSIVLGYVFREYDGTDYTNAYEEVSLGTGGYVPFVMNDATTNDGEILVNNTLPTNELELTFLGTSSVTQSQYRVWRVNKFFDELVSNVLFDRSVIIGIDGNGDYIKLKINQNNWSVDTTGDKKITITVDSAYDIQTEAINNNFVMYNSDDEFSIMLGASLDGLETRVTELSTSSLTLGVVAEYSDLYEEYYNGNINTGDYFYQKLGEINIEFRIYTNSLNPGTIGNYIVMTQADANSLNLSTGMTILTDEHPVNSNHYKLDASFTDADQVGTDLGLLPGEIAFKVPQNINTSLPTMTAVYNYDLKTYLKMYTVNDKLQIRFYADNQLTTPTNIDASILPENLNLKVYSNVENYEQTLEIEEHNDFERTDTEFLIDLVRYPEVVVGDYVKAFVDPNDLEPNEYFNKFARILKKKPWSKNAQHNVQYAVITVDKKVDVQSYGTSNDLQTTRYTSIQKYINTLKTIVLDGFKVQSTSIPDGTEARQNEILDILDKNGSIFKAISNKDKFNFRYLVDSFGLGLTEFSKQQLVNITGKRKNAIAFINMPSARDFKKSSSPSFINPDGNLNLEYVKEGGNLNQNPPFLYSFAQESGDIDGRSTAGYFFPYVTVNDNGRPLNFPPAAYVCNTYTRKLDSSISGIYNWTIAAGIEDGIIRGISNVEMDLEEEDLEQLYLMQANPIVYTKNVGFNIETEWTAQKMPLSSLSYLHSREVLIDLENELYAMLLKYRWKYNTAAIRSKIKREADNICQSFVDRAGLYAFNNVIDETNNTPTIIDNQFGLLETYVEIVKGMGIIVNVINVQATGDIGSSTGFNAQ